MSKKELLNERIQIVSLLKSNLNNSRRKNLEIRLMYLNREIYGK